MWRTLVESRSGSYAGRIAPPGIPKMTSTPISSSERTRLSAPLTCSTTTGVFLGARSDGLGAFEAAGPDGRDRGAGALADGLAWVSFTACHHFHCASVPRRGAGGRADDPVAGQQKTPRPWWGMRGGATGPGGVVALRGLRGGCSRGSASRERGCTVKEAGSRSRMAGIAGPGARKPPPRAWGSRGGGRGVAARVVGASARRSGRQNRRYASSASVLRAPDDRATTVTVC